MEKPVRPVSFVTGKSAPKILGDPAWIGRTCQPNRGARLRRGRQPFERRRMAARNIEPGRRGHDTPLLVFLRARLIAAVRRKALMFFPIAMPPPAFAAAVHHGEMMEMRLKRMHEDGQTMVLIFAQTGVKRRCRISDRLEALAVRHRVLAALAQPVDEIYVFGFALEFLHPLNGAFARRA